MSTCGCRPPYFPEWKNFSDCTFSEHASCISPNPGSHSILSFKKIFWNSTSANQIVSLLFSILLTVTKTVLSNASAIATFVMLNMESTTSQYTGHWKNFPRQQETRILTLQHFRLCNSTIIIAMYYTYCFSYTFRPWRLPSTSK